jgi:hypothetical protein
MTYMVTYVMCQRKLDIPGYGLGASLALTGRSSSVIGSAPARALGSGSVW